MQKNLLIQWCEVATCRICFGPDRKKVADELMGHLEDRRDALMAQGLDENEATAKAMEAMGDAKVIAPQLGAIHKPFWGYLLRVSKILLIILLCVSFNPIRKYVKNLDLNKSVSFQKFDVFDSASYGGDTGRTLLHLSQPELSFSSDGSHFTLTDACVYSQDSEYYGPNTARLYIRIQQTSLLPQTEHQEYFSHFAVASYFSARDSLGNEYPCFWDGTGRKDPFFCASGAQTGLFTYTHECWIIPFPSEAEWVEIIYDRDGRSYTMRVDLTGGVWK